MEVVIAFAHVWNGDYTRTYTYGVYPTMEIAKSKTDENKLPPFSKFTYEAWKVTK